MDIGKDLQRAYDEGYAKGWAEAEAYTLHCGDEKPTTNADRIRSMSDDELAEWLFCPGIKRDMFPDIPYDIAPSTKDWLNWLKQEVKDG